MTNSKPKPPRVTAAAPKRNVPWYEKFREEFITATNYIHASELIQHEIPEETYANFQKESLARFIFESNNLEREGLPFGETRALVFDGLKDLPKLESSFTDINFDSLKYIGEDLSANVRVIAKLSEQQDRLVEHQEEQERFLQNVEFTFIAEHGSKTREAGTVARHLAATLLARSYIHSHIGHQMNQALYWSYLLSMKNVTSMKKYQYRSKNKELTKQQESLLEKIRGRLSELSSDGSPPKRFYLLSEEIIRELHQAMATDLVNPKYSPAGEYRNHSVMTDMESHYPAPSDVPRAMEKFIREYRDREQVDLNPISLAAWASTQFVLIHPFSDFNGRMSRLIANMILRSRQIPFWIALRSNKPDRHRYITALRHYRRDKRESIATIIAKQVNENFVEFNRILELVDHPLIVEKPRYSSVLKSLSNFDLLELKLPIEATIIEAVYEEKHQHSKEMEELYIDLMDVDS